MNSAWADAQKQLCDGDRGRRSTPGGLSSSAVLWGVEGENERKSRTSGSLRADTGTGGLTVRRLTFSACS